MELKSNVLTTRAKYLIDFYGFFLRIFMFFAGHGGMAIFL
jgi:hypothetical protein